jgi:hypothetical protein
LALLGTAVTQWLKARRPAALVMTRQRLRIADPRFAQTHKNFFVRQQTLEKHPYPVADRSRSIHCPADAVRNH